MSISVKAAEAALSLFGKEIILFDLTRGKSCTLTLIQLVPTLPIIGMMQTGGSNQPASHKKKLKNWMSTPVLHITFASGDHKVLVPDLNTETEVSEGDLLVQTSESLFRIAKCPFIPELLTAQYLSSIYTTFPAPL